MPSTTSTIALQFHMVLTVSYRASPYASTITAVDKFFGRSG